MKVMTGPFAENFKMAIDTLKANKLRSFLTIFGVVVGVVTVMLISSAISGFDLAFRKEIESYGTRARSFFTSSTSAFARALRAAKNGCASR